MLSGSGRIEMKDDSLVIDSNIIIALFFPEKYSEWAEKIVSEYGKLLTVDISYAEVVNVAWKKIVLLNHDEKIVNSALEDAINFVKNICVVRSTVELYKKALGIAIDYGITIYDSLFLTLANEEKAKFATLDKKLINKIGDKKFKNMLKHPY